MKLYQRLRRAVQSAALPASDAGRAVTEDDIATLPATARRYLQFMGVVGRRPDWSFRARFRGDFRRRPDGPWLPADAWQFNTSVQPGRIFVMNRQPG